MPETNRFIDKEKSELVRFIQYVTIGVILTALTYILWSTFNYGLELAGESTPEKISIAYFVASFIMIAASLYANRNITFRDATRFHKKRIVTIAIYYATYSATALTASVLNYVATTYLPETTPLYLIKFFTIGINTVLNFASQRFIIFKVQGKRSTK